MIQRDIKYQTNPLGPDGIAGTADDNPNAKNILGIYTSGGDIRIGASGPKDITINASIMAANTGTTKDSVFTVDNYDTRSNSGAVHLTGGVIADRYGAFGTFGSNGSSTGYGRDFVYDRRFQTGKAPPFFPTTSGLDTTPPTFLTEIWNEKVVDRMN